MFSEQYGRKDDDMSRKKCKHSREEEKGLTFDRLEDKLNDELSSMNVKDKEGKAEMKYTPGVQTERVTALSRGKTKSATAIIQKEKHLKTENRSNSLEKQGGETVGFGLFEAANVMCNIVEISKDSTMHRRTHETYAAAPAAHQHQKPTKVNSKSSITSVSSQSGPFAMMKESEKKKKKSIDLEDD